MTRERNFGWALVAGNALLAVVNLLAGTWVNYVAAAFCAVVAAAIVVSLRLFP